MSYPACLLIRVYPPVPVCLPAKQEELIKKRTTNIANPVQTVFLLCQVELGQVRELV